MWSWPWHANRRVSAALFDYLLCFGWRSVWNLKHILPEQGPGSQSTFSMISYSSNNDNKDKKKLRIGTKEQKVSRQNCYLRKVKDN